jgi:peptidyl-prolyl cis-trans isomerase A (cyclophilin A)
MRKTACLCLSFLFCLAATVRTENPQVIIQTGLGDIRVEIFIDQAPVTAENFLRCVDGGLFAEAAFYRVVRMDNQPNNEIKIEVIQGGIRNQDVKRFPPIAHETTEQTGLLHKDGIISMARSAPGTASSEFFICVGDQPELDYGGRRNPDGQGFAAFGRVIKGLDIVKKIQQLPDENQSLISPVPIRDIVRLEPEKNACH